MGRIVATEFISLDGVIEDPGGAEDFEHGGWCFEVERGEAGDAFKLNEVFEAEAQLLGRVTYEGFAAAWPSREDDAGFADRFNSMPKYVVTSTLESADWNNSHILSGDLATEIAKLRDDIDGIVLIAGSAQLVQGLIAADLLDELRLMVFPVILGGGKRLFVDDGQKKSLKLASAKTVGDGISVVIYEKA
jgi:dihydrofolate reductase